MVIVRLCGRPAGLPLFTSHSQLDERRSFHEGNDMLQDEETYYYPQKLIRRFTPILVQLYSTTNAGTSLRLRKSFPRWRRFLVPAHTLWSLTRPCGISHMRRRSGTVSPTYMPYGYCIVTYRRPGEQRSRRAEEVGHWEEGGGRREEGR